MKTDIFPTNLPRTRFDMTKIAGEVLIEEQKKRNGKRRIEGYKHHR